MTVIEPDYFKMRLPNELPKWKRILFKLFGKKVSGNSDGFYCEGYWLNGLCLITKFEEVKHDQVPK